MSLAVELNDLFDDRTFNSFSIDLLVSIVQFNYFFEQRLIHAQQGELVVFELFELLPL